MPKTGESRIVLAPSVNLDHQWLSLLLDNNRMAYLHLENASPALASANYEQAHNMSWNAATRTITWKYLDLTLSWDDLLSKACAIKRPPLQFTRVHDTRPGFGVIYGIWQLRLSWGQVAFWRNYTTLVWWTNPLPWRFGPKIG